MKKYLLFVVILGMFVLIASQTLASVYNFGNVTLKNGSRGEAVKELQRFLNDNLNMNLVLDGIIGPKTITVIKKWQKENGLVSDGLIGPKTKIMMNSIASSQVCCEIFGYGTGMLKTNSTYQMTSRGACTTPENFVGGGRGIVADSFCEVQSSTINSVISYDDFAKCLKEKGAIFYGASWCSHCQNQKALFGSSASFLPYVECSNSTTSDQSQVCVEKNIQGYPTWVFADGSSLSGEQTLETLASKTSCVLPK